MYLEPITYSYQEIACLAGIITNINKTKLIHKICLLYTSDAADEQ